MNMKSNIVKFSCHLCGKRLSHLKSVKRHINTVHNKGNQLRHYCPYCTKSYSRRCDTTRHINQKHLDINSQQNLTIQSSNPFINISKVPKHTPPTEATLASRPNIKHTARKLRKQMNNNKSKHSVIQLTLPATIPLTSPISIKEVIIPPTIVISDSESEDKEQQQSPPTNLPCTSYILDNLHSIDSTSNHDSDLSYIHHLTQQDVFYSELQTTVRYNLYKKGHLKAAPSTFNRHCATSIRPDYIEWNKIKPNFNSNMDTISRPSTPLQDENNNTLSPPHQQDNSEGIETDSEMDLDEMTQMLNDRLFANISDSCSSSSSISLD